MLVRRSRGIVGTALTWSAALAVIGGALASAIALYLAAIGRPIPTADGTPYPLSRLVVVGALGWAKTGLVAGVAYALAVIRAESTKRTFETLSVRRMAVWGALGGLVFPLWNVQFLAHTAPQIAAL